LRRKDTAPSIRARRSVSALIRGALSAFGEFEGEAT
jgi:hypothetical protein